MVTIATHNGSAAHREHNIRNEKVVSKESHISNAGHYEIWKDIPPREAYYYLFNKAVERYNEKQTRDDRKITNYYNKICTDEKKHPVYEMIVGVYPESEMNSDIQKAILRDFVKNWQERNPSLYMCGAYYHNDEEGEPHVHIDYIPVATGYKRGMDTQNGLVKALEQQGFHKKGKETAQIQWQRNENLYLEKLCKERGLEVKHPAEEGREHLRTEVYKAKQQIRELQTKVKELETVETDLELTRQQLEDTLTQKVRAAELKKPLFKKDRTTITYDEDMVETIRSIGTDTHNTLKKALEIQKTNEIEKNNLEEMKSNIEPLYQMARNEYEKYKRLKEQQDKLIQDQAIARASVMLRRALEGSKTDLTERMEEYMEEVKYSDGTSVLDAFRKEEEEREKRAWERLQEDEIEW